MHASYNFLISLNLLGIGFLVIVFLNTRRLHNELKQKQLDKKIEKETKFK